MKRHMKHTRRLQYPVFLFLLVILCFLVGCADKSDLPSGTESTIQTAPSAAEDSVFETPPPVTETESVSDIPTESTSEFFADSEADTEAESLSETATETEIIIETETEIETMTETMTETETKIETMTETITETETKIETVTETETDAGWAPDMGTFNEGKVSYTKNEDGTVTASPADGYTLGLDITDKTDLVSICYTTWFNAILGNGTTPIESWYNITEIEAGRQEWGPATAFHYWAKPEAGYYRSTDKDVIRRHMTQLYAAGVDFIIIDATFLGDHSIDNGWWETYTAGPARAICETIMDMRAEGLGTPYMVFWLGTNKQGKLFKQALNDFFSQDKWKDCFVYWNNKPFVVTWGNVEDCPYPDQLTLRTMRGLQYGAPEDEWSFLTVDSWEKFAVGPDGKPEQVTVAVACQETYMSVPSAHGRMGGSHWFKQWYNAFTIRPKIVTLTWWNEWTAQRLPAPDGGGYIFTDNYNQEYSRDIEPMEGGHGDQYYRWLIEYVSAYKGNKECPVLVEDRYMPIINRWLRGK